MCARPVRRSRQDLTQSVYSTQRGFRPCDRKALRTGSRVLASRASGRRHRRRCRTISSRSEFASTRDEAWDQKRCLRLRRKRCWESEKPKIHLTAQSFTCTPASHATKRRGAAVAAPDKRLWRKRSATAVTPSHKGRIGASAPAHLTAASRLHWVVGQRICSSLSSMREIASFASPEADEQRTAV